MIRSELVAAVRAACPDIDARTVDAAVDAIFETISAALAEGRRVELRGFGVFAVRDREARSVRVPATGEVIAVPPGRMVRFRAGKALRERMNDGSADGSEP